MSNLIFKQPFSSISLTQIIHILFSSYFSKQELNDMTNKTKYDLFALSKELEIDIEDMVEIFSVYFIEVNELILNLRYLYQKKDWIKFKKINHNIKGISSNLRVNDIHEIALRLDNLVEIGFYDDIDNSITELDKISKQSQIEINEIFIQNGLKV